MNVHAEIVIENGDRELFSIEPGAKDFLLFGEGWHIKVPYAHIERWIHELTEIKTEIEAREALTNEA